MKITNIAKAKIKFKFIVISTEANFLFCPLDTSTIFIQKITIGTKLTRY